VLRRIRNWLRTAPLADPIQRRQAILFQILLIATLGAVAANVIGNVLVMGSTALSVETLLPPAVIATVIFC
jgi:hypothetical protein